MGRFILPAGQSQLAGYEGLEVTAFQNATTTAAIAGPVHNIPAATRNNLLEHQAQRLMVPAGHTITAGIGRLYLES